MSGIFLTVLLCSGLWALMHGSGEALGAQLLAAGDHAVSLVLTLAGAYMIWCGLMNVLQQSGVTQALAAHMRRPVRALLGKEGGDEEVCGAVCLNLTANLLGLGNAATPAGLRAMERMAELAQKPYPTHGMCMFLLLNTSSLQLIPTTVLSLRAAYGTAKPADILLPTLAGSAVATGLALLLGLVCGRMLKA